MVSRVPSATITSLYKSLSAAQGPGLFRFHVILLVRNRIAIRIRVGKFLCTTAPVIIKFAASLLSGGVTPGWPCCPGTTGCPQLSQALLPPFSVAFRRNTVCLSLGLKRLPALGPPELPIDLEITVANDVAVSKSYVHIFCMRLRVKARVAIASSPGPFSYAHVYRHAGDRIPPAG